MSALFQAVEEHFKFDLECERKRRKSSQTWFFPPKFQVGDVVLVEASLNREIKLPPAAILP